ncbi:uncharacterized protein LOC129602327 [Paramacrobiotus metropolitanus]|uniref:uncharacterized protein LOC129602327 n=1 Tax=Paramacrobiotus metropolitanus TaxID=2943436 RepID=UPI002445BEBA|nr:uncharacterized protein LOC129602327 [Paramacrobiotus metropolitanus]XP_055357302.1 uncharacterized protein LOC129602327 [Paramacrobiotus metropolitanus]
MHLYELSRRYAWNTVDVEIDGQLQRGHVVGMEENGTTPPRLIVDFQGPEQRSVLVEYGKVTTGISSWRASEGSGTEVLVLLRDHQDRWSWYPGKVLHSFGNGSLEDYATVEVTRAGYRSCELVLCNQIQLPLSKDPCYERLVKPGDFVVGTCRVPDGYWTEWTRNPSRAESLLENLYRHSVRFFNVRSQAMNYVRVRYTYALTDEDVAREFELERQKLSEVSSRKDHDVDSSPAVEKMSNALPCKQWFRHFRADKNKLRLPLELLKEIFLLVDTVDRQRCRRTCQLWETLLTSADLCQDVRISRQDYGLDLIEPYGAEGNSRQYHYVVCVCLFKYVTALTRTVCLFYPTETFCDERENLTAAHEAIGLAKNILDSAGLRVHRWIEYGRSLTIPIYRGSVFDLRMFLADAVALNSQLASRCDRLIWAHYSLDCQNEYEGVFMKFRIPFTVFTPDKIDEAQMWDVFEQHCCDGWQYDAQDIADFIANSTDSRARAKEVKRILKDYQACDPRASAHYCGHKWTLDNLAEVKVRKLNKFCLFALSDYVSLYEESGSEESSDSLEDD